jgi:hypothetical protein
VFTAVVGHVPELTAFPGWDERVKCTVLGEDGADEEEGAEVDTAKVVAIAEKSHVLLNR